MKKLIYVFDTYALKIGVAFLLIFTALYPKLPSVHIIRTWVYIRLEDFFILAVTLIWLILLVRKKVKLYWPFTIPISIYWLVGLISLIYSIIFIGPHLLNYFPHIAALNYVRRIEYMILFFVALSTIKSIKDIRDYIVILALTSLGVVLYGLGQRYYIDLWIRFPEFFEKYSFCFPSFQTGNEEYAKGIPLCLPSGSRITSTFGGHYDLAAYMVLVLPILLSVGLSIKKLYARFFMLILFVLNYVILILTSSRISFIAYLAAVVTSLILFKKKIFIIPVLVISIFLLLVFSESTFRRFMATARFSNVVTNMQGQMIGETTSGLSDDLKKKLSKNQLAVQGPPPVQNLPKGSGYIGLPQQASPVQTNVAVVEKTLSPEEIRKLKITSGSIQISTVSGNFLIRKVLVYDISFTTRFQSEWPKAWEAFMRNPVLGSGYSTITLATDNDYFRALGETGLLGLFSFLFIFLILGIGFKEIRPSIKQNFVLAFIVGLAGGVIGLMINAFLIDVFEASKVAENLWLLLGIGSGALILVNKKTIPYLKILKNIFTSHLLIAFYILILTLSLYLGSINNYFVADDFTNLRLAAESSTGNLLNYFINSQQTFYDPVIKLITFFLFSLFALSPQGYHMVNLLLHFSAVLGLYLLSHKILKNRLLAFFSALVFLVNPLNVQNIFWYSSIPVTLVTVFMIYSLNGFINFRAHKSTAAYISIFVLTILAFMTSPIAAIIPLLIIVYDLILLKNNRNWRKLLIHLPFIVLIPVYFVITQITNSSIDLSRLSLLYPVSAGLSILIVVVFDIISKLITGQNNFKSKILLVIVILTILIYSTISIQKQNLDWNRAGNFIKIMLSVLSFEYKDLTKNSQVYFISPPEKFNSAWVLPAGLEDSIWFIYLDNNPKVRTVNNEDQARKIIQNNKVKNSYIFKFKNDGDIIRIN